MPLNSPSVPGPDPAEAPTGFAELEIQVGPAQSGAPQKGRCRLTRHIT